jgi:GDP-4-dehydro-6-deoxy-D-mannose reductase
MRKALITGVTGFAGSFLAEYLLSTGFSVSGTHLTPDLGNITSIKDKLKLHELDLMDAKSVVSLINDEKPDFVFHLAALSSASESFDNPADFITNNISSQVNIFEGIRKASILPRVLITSSAEIYGDVAPSNLPIDEDTPIRPVNPYAVSKLAQDFLGLQYFLAYKIPIIRVRPFNHIGPRQSPAFVVPSFAKKIAEIEKGKSEPVIKVGNLNAKRDFTNVNDIVRAYAQVIEKGDPGEVYNIGFGESYKVEDILNRLLSLSEKKISIEIDQNLLRPIDAPDLICDNKKIKDKTGWEPKISIDETLKETLEYWREHA